MANERINGENFSIVVHPFQVTLGCGRLTKKKRENKQKKQNKKPTKQTSTQKTHTLAILINAKHRDAKSVRLKLIFTCLSLWKISILFMSPEGHYIIII